MKLPKILAPVRDQTSLTAAINAGADAVYFGIGELNMRISSKGIDLEELAGVVKTAHQQQVEVYVTLNVIVYEQELAKLGEILDQIKVAGVDAVICWDWAVIEGCRERKINFHISTQASVSNSVAAKYYQDLGASCLVLARECTLDQIKEIKEKVDVPIEIFVHGAMCVSVSGRCFLSQFLNCKSANRGECSQPCRRNYKVVDAEGEGELEISNGYVLSPKDLCTLGMLDQVVATGVDVLKIEGRSRSAEYVAAVVGAYRQALDVLAAGEYGEGLVKKLLAEVERVYNRGFSTGFLYGRPGEEGWAKSRDNQATEMKQYLGKVTNYFKKTQIVEAVLTAGELQSGEEVYIQGPTTGSVRLEVSEIKSHPEGELTWPCEPVVRRGDQVFVIRSTA